MTDEQQLTAAGNEMSASFLAAKKRSDETLAKLEAKPSSFTMLTGDRPTGRLHLGHYFGSIRERVAMQERGVNTNIIIADYQVITDRDTTEHIQDNVLNLVLDYMAAGIDPNKTMMFTHSAVPAENQLLLPFLSLVTEAELHRNPTVKSEMEASGHALTGLLLTYPVHQACDILFCKANVVPIGKDNLPHVEITRTIARRFNERYAKKNPVFPEPAAILSEAPEIPGLDGRKMSKSYGNSIMLGATAEETAKLIKKSPTDSERRITFDPVARPQVSALLTTAGLVTLPPPTLEERNCIRCGACARVCPSRLMPFAIDAAVVAGKMDVCADYGGSARPLNGKGLSGCAGNSIQLNYGYSISSSGAKALMNQGYGWIMWFAFDPSGTGTVSNNRSHSLRQFRNVAEGCYEQSVRDPKNVYNKISEGQYDPAPHPIN